jgi:polyribonucleotide nucleotidyltransferase
LKLCRDPREKLSPYAPRIEKIQINPDKIGAVIGKGGDVIKKITAETGAQIDIAEDGLITVAAVDTKAIEQAMNWIKGSDRRTRSWRSLRRESCQHQRFWRFH